MDNFKKTFLGLAIGLFTLLPIAAQATVSIPVSDQSPAILALPASQTVIGAQISAAISASDPEGKPLTYSLTSAPAGMTADASTGALTWTPTQLGRFGVNAEIRDPAGNRTLAFFGIEVVPGAIASIAITPNDRPTRLTVGGEQMFTVTAADAFGNPVEPLMTNWSSLGDVGVIDPDGSFLATQAGTGSIVAEVGDVRAQIGIVVKSTKPKVLAETVETITPPAQASTSQRNVEPRVAGESVTLEEEPSTNGEATTTEESSKSPSCWDPTFWPSAFVFLAYIVLIRISLAIPHRRRWSLWWVGPLVIVALALVLLFAVACASGDRWWWMAAVLVVGGFITAAWRPRGPANHEPIPPPPAPSSP